MKLGFVSMPLSGHLNPMTALARRMQSRGHEAVFLGVPDVEPFAHAAGVGFVPFGEKEFPVGSIATLYGEVARRHGLDVVQHSCRELNPGLIRVGLEYLPAKLQQTGVEAVVLDTIAFFHELAPMSLGIPYVHIWNVLHLDFSGLTPMGLFSWPHDTTREGLERNLEALQQAGALFAPMITAARPYAEKMGLEIDFSDPGSTTSKLAVITQTPREFDFPGAPWPPQFHYAGPFHDDAGREPVSFPWEKLTGAPLIYASLGTLVNGLNHVYSAILRAVEKLPGTQVVLSVGKNLDLDELGAIPSNVIVVRSAPQIELLKRAQLCITHAGLNTTLEALGQGVPMVAIPIGYDQPGVAARIAHHGVGDFVEVDELTPVGLRGLIQKVMENPSYGEKAWFFKEVIARTRGLDVAADVIERALVAGRLALPSREAAQRAQGPTIIGTNSTGTPDRASMPDGGRTSTRSSCSPPPPTGITRRPPGASRATGTAGTSRGAAVTPRLSKGVASGQPHKS
jgi:zeaxanthin glucosyltransferase